MVPAIVPIYAAVLAFIYIVLSARVIQARRSSKVAIGTRNMKQLAAGRHAAAVGGFIRSMVA